MAHAKKKIIAVVAGMAVFAAVSASAATLGGITVDSVGAETGTVNGPVTGGVTVSWDVAHELGVGYVVEGATITAGGGQSISAEAQVLVTVLGEDELGNDVVLAELTGTAGAVEVPEGTVIPVAEVYGVDVVVNGN